MLTSKARLSKGRENLLGAVLLSRPGRPSTQHARPRCAPPPVLARTYCKKVLSRSSKGPVLASEPSPLFPPVLGRPSQARPHRQPRRLRADCERTRRAIVRCRVKVDDGGSPAEAATTPGIPNPPCRNPQAGIPITFLSPRTIPRPRLSFSSLHTMATSEASPHTNAVLECGVKLPLYIFLLSPSP